MLVNSTEEENHPVLVLYVQGFGRINWLTVFLGITISLYGITCIFVDQLTICFEFWWCT